MNLSKEKEDKMKTSKIKIRPFIPYMKDEEKLGREEFAILQYGNVEIELDYTLMGYLEIICEADCFTKAVAIAKSAFAEIIKEMHSKMDDKLPPHHRDTGSGYVKSFIHNPLHPINKEITIGKQFDQL